MTAPVQPEITVEIAMLPHAVGLPVYASEGAAGADLMAAPPEDAPIRLAPGARTAIPTGLTLAIPRGFEAQIRPRSGLALRQGLTVLNAPGTIDSDYRGELAVLMVNLGEAEVVIERGLRIAQMVIAPAPQARFVPVDSLDDTIRGAGGFGSTGTGAAPKR